MRETLEISLLGGVAPRRGMPGDLASHRAAALRSPSTPTRRSPARTWPAPSGPTRQMPRPAPTCGGSCTSSAACSRTTAAWSPRRTPWPGRTSTGYRVDVRMFLNETRGGSRGRRRGRLEDLVRHGNAAVDAYRGPLLPAGTTTGCSRPARHASTAVHRRLRPGRRRVGSSR